MIALIKIDKSGILDILHPIPDWVDPLAFAIFDCYGYSLCADYTPPADDTIPAFGFSTKKIENPFRHNEDDPETVTLRIATQL